MMKIKNITIRFGSNTQELILSADDTKNVNFVIGNNDTGKTRTFNAIKAYFLKNKTDAKVEIELIDAVDDFDIDLMFVDDSYLEKYLETLLSKKEFSTQDLIDISQKTNEILSTIGGRFEHHKNPLELQNNKITINYNFAAGESTIIFFALHAAIREKTGSDLPMIIDGGLGRLNPEHISKIIEMLANNVPQLLIFLIPDEFSQLSEFLEKNGILGSVYFLENHEFRKRNYTN